MAEAKQELGWHRVCLNTIVRATKDLDSARLRILPMGSRVNVVEVVGRRVKIDQPIDGWCSIESSNGDLILSKTQDEAPADHNDEGKEAFDADRVDFQQQQRQINEFQGELSELRKKVEQANLKKKEAQKNEVLSEELKKEVDDLEAKAREQERLIEEKKRELEELANKASSLGEMAAAQNAVVKNKLYKLMSGLDADNSDGSGGSGDALPSKDTSHDTHLLNGDVVMIDDQKGLAIVRFVGEVDFSDQVMLGAELSDPIGDCDGTKESKTYFSCRPNHGCFFPLQGVKKKIPAEHLLQKLHAIVKKLNMSRSAVEGRS